MIYPKANAKGVDYKINLWIARLNKGLNTQQGWDVDIYHKVYREYTNVGLSNGSPKSGIAPYTFLSVKDYKPVFLNDKVVGEIGFLLGTVRDNSSGSFTVPMDMIFSLNLDKIDEGSTQREDEKAIITVQNIVSKYAEVLSVKTTIPEVFKGFDIERIKRKDRQPFLNFSISIKLMYKNICNGL
jgi:hypothetical protein